MAAAFDISSAIERPKIGGFGLRLILVSWLVTFFDGYDMNVISFASKRMQAAFDLSSPAMGWVFTSGIFGTLLGGFLFGYIGDRLGRRPTIIISVATFALLTLALGFARS